MKKIRDITDWILNALHLARYREEILYLAVGAGTTAVDWIIYTICVLFIPSGQHPFLDRISPNITAYAAGWLCAVLFAYLCSRGLVFESSSTDILREFGTFVMSRVITLVLSVAGDILLCGQFAVYPVKNPFAAKVIISVLVVIINYLTSKFIVFKKTA